MSAHDGDGREFSYTYSAPTEEERREIEGIRSAYVPASPHEDKLERLRKLDSRVRGIPSAVAIAIGVVGLLIFGGGLSLCLGEFSAAYIAAGIVLSVVGAAVMAVAKPVHARMFRRMKAKYGQEILQLSEELLGKE